MRALINLLSRLPILMNPTRSAVDADQGTQGRIQNKTKSYLYIHDFSLHTSAGIIGIIEKFSNFFYQHVLDGYIVLYKCKSVLAFRVHKLSI